MLRMSVCLIALSVAAPVLAQSEVAMSDVPDAVLDTAIETAPGVTFTKVRAESEGGRTVYEFEGRTHDGKHIEVDIFDDGSLEEVEMEMAFDELPPAVRQTMDAEYPGFRATYVESSVRSNGDFVYEIEGVSAAGAALVLEVSESGEFTSSSGGPKS